MESLVSDLNIPFGPQLEGVLRESEQLGYELVAVNTEIDESFLGTVPKKRKHGEATVVKEIPSPPELTPFKKNCRMKILSRLTLTLGDPALAFRFTQNQNTKKYDLLAVRPKSLSALQYCITSSDIDLISLPISVAGEGEEDLHSMGGLPFRVSRKAYNQAVSNRLLWEFNYAPMLHDQRARMVSIRVANELAMIGRSRNWILSSSAGHPRNLRSPQDLMHLLILFGFQESETRALALLQKNPSALVSHAFSRRHPRAVFTLVSEHASISDSA